MRAKGITYDTGFVRQGAISRERFDPHVVQRELGIIRDDLHCNAVRITGGDPARLELAATSAADPRPEGWVSPYPLELTADAMLTLSPDCAERAERVRQRGAEVVFVGGAELSLMNPGFLRGETAADRVALLLNAEPDRRRERVGELSGRVNDFLRDAVAGVRERFGGRLAHAATPRARVHRTPLDCASAG